VRRRPVDKRLRQKLRAVVDADCGRAAMERHQVVEHADDASARERDSDRDLQALAIALVENRQRANPPTVVQGVADEVQGPGLIEYGRRRERLA
jgi:hypothetical protein